ncbi:glycosyltransferase family 4 protein [Candidatus Omnitrophota bacterium]
MEKKIRVLHAITRLDRGGSSENTLLSVIGLAERGYSVDLLFGRTETPNLRLLEKAENAGVEFIEEEDLVRDIHPFKDLLAFLNIRYFLKRKDYDIVHAHSSKAGLICRFAARSVGIKHIIYTPHGHVFYGYFGRFLSRLIVFSEAITARITDKIVGLTQSECDEWLERGVGKKDQYLVIPSGVEFDMMEKEASARRYWKEEMRISEDKILVGAVGRFIKIKGFEYFIEAGIEQIKKRDDICFLLAGDGPLREKYEDMISSSGVGDRFRIIGWQEITAAMIEALDIFVLSSLNEGMGRVLIEAMYFAKPVIATRVGGVPSVVSGNAGLLVEPSSSLAILDAINKLLGDMQASREMGVKGRKKAIAEYSYEYMIEKLDDMYKELLGA